MIGIGDFDAKARNRRQTVTRLGQKMFNGKKYAQDKKTGYYVCTSGNRQRLHDAIWLYHNGMTEIPKGCVVHHIDENKTNNDINNLTCVSVFGHNLIHNPSKDSKMKWKVVIVPGGESKIIEITIDE